MADGKAYGELGEVIDKLARSRNIRGPYKIARFVREKAGEGPSGSAWSEFLYGKSRPKPEVMKLFRVAFELTEDEFKELALVYTFRGDEFIRVA